MNSEDGRVILNFICQALRGKSLSVYGDGTQIRSFCYIDDLLEGLLLMMDSDDDFSGSVNLGNPEQITINHLSKLVISKINNNFSTVNEKLLADDPSQRCPDITLAKTKLNWKPKISISAGLDKTIDYFREKLK